MTSSSTDPFETILRQCAAAAPHPWYPRAFAEAAGVPRETMEPFLERLRLHGLIRLTEWVQGNGQGYELTAEGERVLQSNRLMVQVRAGNLPAAPPEPDDVPDVRRGRLTSYDRGEIIRDALLGSPQPVVTYLLLSANIAVFLWGAWLANQNGVLNKFLSGSTDNIVHRTGGITGADLLAGEWWRLLSCCFVHIGGIHLLVNMYSLYVVGPLFEKMWGPWRALIIYLISGLVGSCAAMIFTPGGLVAGASGALWGVMIGIGAWVFLNRSFLPSELASSLLRRIGIVVLLNIVISFVPGISKEAHFGGGIAGMLTAWLLNYARFARGWPRLLSLVAVMLVPLVPLAELVRERNRTVGARAEMEQINEEVGPQARQLQQQAEKAYELQVEKLLEQHPRRRDPNKVQKALAALLEAQEQLHQAADILEKAGPYTSLGIQRYRNAYKDWIEEQAKLFALYERCLREGENWTEQDEQGLTEQAQRVQEAYKQLQAARHVS
jgi:membrane associated rhomboid family serine protease